jgi:hypothetical protein
MDRSHLLPSNTELLELFDIHDAIIAFSVSLQLSTILNNCVYRDFWADFGANSLEQIIALLARNEEQTLIYAAKAVGSNTDDATSLKYAVTKSISYNDSCGITDPVECDLDTYLDISEEVDGLLLFGLRRRYCQDDFGDWEEELSEMSEEELESLFQMELMTRGPSVEVAEQRWQWIADRIKPCLER